MIQIRGILARDLKGCSRRTFAQSKFVPLYDLYPVLAERASGSSLRLFRDYTTHATPTASASCCWVLREPKVNPCNICLTSMMGHRKEDNLPFGSQAP